MTTQTRHTVTAPALVLVKSLTQLWKPLAVHVAAQLHLAEALADGPRTVSELAEETGTHAPSLYRLLRALVRIGIFAELDGSRFANNEPSHFLRPDVSGSIYGMAMASLEPSLRTWNELLHSVRTGEPGFDKAHGMPLWRYFAEHDPAIGARFNASVASLSAAVDIPVVQAADLSEAKTVVDVGGGYGGLLTTLLTTYPAIEQGILFDQPHVIDEARAVLGAELDERIQLVGGDFFTAVPAGADVYMIKWVLHHWDDTACHQLLRNCVRAMTPHSRLLAAEIILDPDHSDEFVYFLDLEMLVNLAGKERTAAEFRKLYDAAGLHLTRIIPTASIFSLVEGIPVRQ